ncbi:MAG TPA: EpsI family protein [Terriglobales bacterium]|nr:EpsI family protein [Terriglobales bacterium]
MKSNLKFAVAMLLLAGTAVFLQARSRNEIVPQREPLSSFPRELGGWTGIDVPIPPDQLEVLGPGDFLLRVYQSRPVPQPYVDLFVAYFASQRAGDTIHSPKNCLPGAGWSPVQSSTVFLSLPGRQPFPANRYVIAKGSDRQLVLYWYWAHGRAVASEYWAKFYLVADSMRMNRSDGSMVRITTPLVPGEDIGVAQQRLVSFASNVVGQLDDYVPR